MDKEILYKRGYEPGEVIGVGGTACVYRVRKMGSKAQYACKISKNLRWLGMESELLRSLDHPLFPKWKDYWEASSEGYMIMEYISGCNLEIHLRHRKTFSQEETIRIALELADGLGSLHERDPMVIYRDLKPANIILQPDGRARLLDLGAAAVPDGWLAGTPGYAAPEQLLCQGIGAMGRQVHGWAEVGLQPCCDVYGLGMVMHHMLTGRNPLFSGDEIMPARKYESKIRRGLEDIVWRCICIQPRERIPGMRELARELGGYYHRSMLQIMCKECKRLWGRRWEQKVVHGKNVWMSEYKV